MEGSFSTKGKNHYIRSIEVYRQKSGNLSKIAEILNRHLPLMIQNILNNRPRRHQFNSLSVGSGDGKPDFEIVKIVKELLKKEDDQVKIFNRVVEPCGHSLSLYRAAVLDYHRYSNTPQTAIFEFHKKTFAEYMELEKKDTTKFDIIHFIHSIYFVDVEATLVYCFEKELTENGLIVCIVGDKDLMYQCCLKQCHVWHEGNQTTESWMTAENILQIADDNGWKHQEFIQEYFIDVTDVFDEESIQGNLLLDFLTCVKNFRKVADKKRVEETLDLIQELTTLKNGKRLGKGIDHLLFIYK